MTIATRYSLNSEKRSDLSKLHGVRAVYLDLLYFNHAHLSLFRNALRFQTQLVPRGCFQRPQPLASG